jgi:hypothetical protein
MPVPSINPQDSDSILVIAVLVAGVCVRYWRMVLQLTVIALIALVAYGLFIAVHGL